MNAKDLQTIKAAAQILDELSDADVDQLNKGGARPYVAQDELERIIRAVEKKK